MKPKAQPVDPKYFKVEMTFDILTVPVVTKFFRRSKALKYVWEMSCLALKKKTPFIASQTKQIIIVKIILVEE